MTFDLAFRLTEILLAWAFLQQSMEHLKTCQSGRSIFMLRMFLSGLLIFNIFIPFICLALLGTSLFLLHKYDGPYNGGSDRMGILILICLTISHFIPQTREYVFGYLALQLILSYVIAGIVKLRNPEWRNGQALRDVFEFSSYPMTEDLRILAQKPRLLFVASWAVILFEIFFPLSLITQETLLIGLGLAAFFHLANAVLFGLNRFFWVWIAAYPTLIWFQDRIF